VIDDVIDMNFQPQKSREICSKTFYCHHLSNKQPDLSIVKNDVTTSRNDARCLHTQIKYENDEMKLKREKILPKERDVW